MEVITKLHNIKIVQADGRQYPVFLCLLRAEASNILL